MGSLSALTQAEVQAIADAIAARIRNPM